MTARPLLGSIDLDRAPASPHELFAADGGDGLHLRAVIGDPADPGFAATARPEDEHLTIVLRGVLRPGEADEIGAGGFLYAPAGSVRTCASAAPGTRALRLAWHGRIERSRQRLPVSTVALDPFSENRKRGPLIEGSTRWLRRLHLHLSRVPPGGGYAAHRDRYGVMLVMLDGEIGTLGSRLGPGDFAYAPAGVPHGLHNTGNTDAIYLAIELHAPRRRFAGLRRRARGFAGRRPAQLQYP